MGQSFFFLRAKAVAAARARPAAGIAASATPVFGLFVPDLLFVVEGLAVVVAVVFFVVVVAEVVVEVS